MLKGSECGKKCGHNCDSYCVLLCCCLYTYQTCMYVYVYVMCKCTVYDCRWYALNRSTWLSRGAVTSQPLCIYLCYKILPTSICILLQFADCQLRNVGLVISIKCSYCSYKKPKWIEIDGFGVWGTTIRNGSKFLTRMGTAVLLVVMLAW